MAHTLKGLEGHLLAHTYQQIGEGRLLAVAAGEVFYGLLAVFPDRYRVG